MPENQALGYFLRGLRSEIRGLIGIHEPKTVMRAMSLALTLKNQLWVSPLIHILLIQFGDQK